MVTVKHTAYRSYNTDLLSYELLTIKGIHLKMATISLLTVSFDLVSFVKWWEKR